MFLPVFQPLGLGRKPEPFSHPDWLFEIKFDGFRALAQIEHGRCRLVHPAEELKLGNGKGILIGLPPDAPFVLQVFGVFLG